MNENVNSIQRVIGLDSHPDSFTAAMLRGLTPASAITEKIFNKIPISQLPSWAAKNTTPEDLLVLEASGNSFEVVRTLEAKGRKALVLESCQIGKLKDTHANNDKISAVRIAKAYLAGTAKVVWVPDLKTQEWRDWFLAHDKTQRRTTQIRNRIQSYLSDNGVRLKKGTHLASDKTAEGRIKTAKEWSPSQWQVLQILLEDLRHAEVQRKQWRSLIAQEVLKDPLLLSITRLCGVRDLIAFALGAIIGDIHRFAEPRKLVKYVGLNPSFDDSGENTWQGGIGGHGRKDLRSLLIQASHSILRSRNHPLTKWAGKLLARKGAKNLVVAAVARKLTVAVWYLMMGRWTALEEIDKARAVKVGQMINIVGKQTLEKLGKTPASFRKEIYDLLKAGQNVYLLNKS